MGSMYSRVGRKLMTLAMIVGMLGAFDVLMAVISMVNADQKESNILFVVVGVVAVIASWPLYAFGQMVEDVQDMADDIRDMANDIHDMADDIRDLLVRMPIGEDDGPDAEGES